MRNTKRSHCKLCSDDKRDKAFWDLGVSDSGEWTWTCRCCGEKTLVRKIKKKQSSKALAREFGLL